MSAHPWKSLLSLALLFTLLAGLKPLHMDETANSYYAAQIADRPLDPYGFVIFWQFRPQPAHTNLNPPLLPYWWSAGLRLFGDRPFLWKLWLLPFSFLFVASLHALLRRFAQGLEMPLLWMTILSPAFLPSLNLMTDVPALALSLFALTVFQEAGDRESWALAALAGLIAGLAMQTKYTGFLAPAAMLLYAVVFRKLRFWPVAAAVAGILFASWEFWVAWLYGESHFLPYLLGSGGSPLAKIYLIPPLLTNLGGVFPAGALLGLTALGQSRRVVAIAGAAMGLGYALIAYVPDGYTVFFRDPKTGSNWVTLPRVVFGIFGAVLCGIVAAAVWRLCVTRMQDEGSSKGLFAFHRLSFALRPSRRVEWFLVLWLGLELAGYFALTPFPAVRRVIGVVIIMTLVAGRLASQTCRSRTRAALVRGVVAFGITLGLGFYWVDLRDASAQKEAAVGAAALVRDRGEGGTLWYVGHWGFQFYAERSGMKPVVPYYVPEDGPIRLPQPSLLRRRDWLVVPVSQQQERLSQQMIRIEEGHNLEWVAEWTVSDLLPLRTVACYYGGSAPLQHHEGPRFWVTIYRVTADFVPMPPTDDESAQLLARLRRRVRCRLTHHGRRPEDDRSAEQHAVRPRRRRVRREADSDVMVAEVSTASASSASDRPKARAGTPSAGPGDCRVSRRSWR